MAAWDGAGEWLCEESWVLDQRTGCGAEIANIVCEIAPGDRARAVDNLAEFHEEIPLSEMSISMRQFVMRMYTSFQKNVE